MDYSQIGTMVADVVKQALPIGIIFILAERLVQMFLTFAFPKIFKGGIQMYDYYYTEYFKTNRIEYENYEVNLKILKKMLQNILVRLTIMMVKIVGLKMAI